MKTFIFLLVVLFTGGAVFSQTDDSTRYIWYKYQYGQRMARIYADSVFRIPTGDTIGVPPHKGSLRARHQDSATGVIYKGDGFKWNAVGPVGKLDSVTISTATDPDPDSLFEWRGSTRSFVGLIPKGGGGSTDTTIVEAPIYVRTGTKDTLAFKVDPSGGLDTNPTDSALRIASSGAANQVMYWTGTRTFAGDAGMTYDATTDLLTFGNYRFGSNANFSGINRASKLYGGVETNRWRDSTRESRFIIRLPFDGSGIITPTFIQDTDHELVGYDSIKAVSSDIVTYRPTVNDVHSIWVQQDETLARLVGGFGPSVGLSSTTIRGYRHSTWGGAIYWNTTTRTWYADGAVINDNTPGSITYDSTTGILTMTMTTWMTTGSERDYKKLAASMSQEGLKVTFMVQNSSNTLLQFKITGTDGSVVPPYYFNGTTAFTFVMPTWHTQLPLGDIGGSNSWLQNFITSQSNLWGGQTDKRN